MIFPSSQWSRTVRVRDLKIMSVSNQFHGLGFAWIGEQLVLQIQCNCSQRHCLSLTSIPQYQIWFLFPFLCYMVVYLKNDTKGLSLPTGHWRLEKREEFVWLFDHDLNLRLTVILLKCLDLLKGKPS